MNYIIQAIGIKNILLYFIIVNLIGFFMMGIDKWKAKRNRWRIPENTLFMATVIGGGIGTILGMYVFRHKTKKPIFKIGMPLVLILEILLVVVLYFKS